MAVQLGVGDAGAGLGPVPNPTMALALLFGASVPDPLAACLRISVVRASHQGKTMFSAISRPRMMNAAPKTTEATAID